MRYARIFFLNFQQAFIYREISFIYFLSSVFNIGLVVLFWRGSVGGKAIIPGWHFADIFTYYVLALIATQLLIPHQENDIARLDIHEGGLSAQLLKPFSYIISKFISELPWRIMAGGFGVLVFLFFLCIVRSTFIITHDPFIIALSICMAILAYGIAFLFKMILGIMAFWFIEMRGLFEATQVITIILIGDFIPLILLPHWLFVISNLSPFPYMVYFPIISFEGKLSIYDIEFILGKELLWLVVFILLYQLLWRKGLKRYSAVGQ